MAPRENHPETLQYENLARSRRVPSVKSTFSPWESHPGLEVLYPIISGLPYWRFVSRNDDTGRWFAWAVHTAWEPHVCRVSRVEWWVCRPTESEWPPLRGE